MTRIIQTSALVLLMMLPAWALAAGPGLLTVSGTIENTNRAPFTESHEGMFAFHGITFDRGFQFDRAMLEALPQTVVEEQSSSSADHYSGPLLDVVLDHVGAQGGRIVVTGLDGFAAEFDRNELAKYRPIVAIDLEGQPLTIGEYGPVKLSFPATGDAETDKDLRSRSVWAVFHISVEDD